MKTLILLLSLLSSTAIFGQNISRGPYLQLRTQTGIQVRFNTNTSCSPHVKYGLLASNLNNVTSSSVNGTSHSLTIGGLQANTKYYYAIYNGSTKLEGTAVNYFITTQLPNSEQKIKIWATGDCGTGSTEQVNIKNQFLNYVGNNYIDAWLLLGDNAYNTGTDAEYQEKFFKPYQNDRIMKQSNIYPVPGNHDYANSDVKSKDHNISFFNIFSPSKNGEMGGVSSNHKEYYSFDIGNVHFVALDSYGRETTNPNAYPLSDILNSPQIIWLKQDLAANTKKWTILFWHHPPYTMGTHNSDTDADLMAIRKNLIPIVESYNVDLVLNGHSHNYERSKMMKNHFGLEASFSPTQHLVSTSSGYYDGSANSCPYQKKSNGSVKGTVYAVAGSSGGNLYIQPNAPHDALPFYTTAYGGLGGSVYIEIEGDRLDFKMISQNGSILDKFTMVKDMNQKSYVDIPSNLPIFELKSPYREPSNWVSNANLATSISITHPVNGMLFQVQDAKNCLKDTLVLRSINPCENAIIMDYKPESLSNINVKSGYSISGLAILPSMTQTTFDAKSFIELKPGFETKSNTLFTAKIGGCNNPPPN